MKVTKAQLKEIIKDELSKLDEIPTWRKIKHRQDGTLHPGLGPLPPSLRPQKKEHDGETCDQTDSDEPGEEGEEEPAKISTPRIDPTSTSPKSRRFRAKGQRK